jgi:Fibronectin type III domain
MRARRSFMLYWSGIASAALIASALAVVPTVGALGAAPALAASPTTPIVSFTSVPVPEGLGPISIFADNANTKILRSSDATGLEVAGTSQVGGVGFNFTITPPAGGSLRPGFYPVRIQANGATDPTLPAMTLDYSNTGFNAGDLDILDLAWDSTGHIQRFDITFRAAQGSEAGGFSGEMRWGEPEASAVHASAHQLGWNEPPIGYPAQVQTEWLHNSGTTGAPIGATSVTGAASHDYAVTANSCSVHTLAAGANCAISVGYTATAPGPRNATLSFSDGNATQKVELSGTGPLGVSSITTSGSDILDNGITHTVADGSTYDLTSYAQPIGFNWQSNAASGDNAVQSIVWMNTALGDTPLVVGTHQTVEWSTAKGSQYGESTSVNDYGCEFTTGTMDVKAFAEDQFGNPSLANIMYTEPCTGGTLNGTLLWHWRTDTTAPNAPTSVAVTGTTTRTSSWLASTSTDVAHTITRLVEGDGSAATPTSGYAVADGSATSAALPALQPNQQYTVLVYAVDASGNVSTPGSTSFTTGAVAQPITLAGAPTDVTVVAGNGTAKLSFQAPANDGGTPITGYVVETLYNGPETPGATSPITVTGLTNGTPYRFVVWAVTAVGAGADSAQTVAVTPVAPTNPPPPPPSGTQLLPDPGFEAGIGGWVLFGTGAISRVSTPVHSGLDALQVTATSASPVLAGITQNSVVTNSVAGKQYSFSCWVNPSTAGLTVYARFLEYTQNYSSDIHIATATAAKLPANVWTQVVVNGVAVNSGERVIPQIYAGNETTATGVIRYDDCSVTAG